MSHFFGALLLGRWRIFVLRCLDLLHPAASFENNPFIHHHSRSLDVSKDLSRRMDFDLLGGKEVASNLPANDQLGDLDLGLDDSVISNKQDAVRQDLAFEMTIDPDCAGKRELSLKLRILPQKRVDFVPSFHVSISAHRIRFLPQPKWVGKGIHGRDHWNMKRRMLMFIRSPMPTMVERIDEPP
jgi:hypothetical protein